MLLSSTGEFPLLVLQNVYLQKANQIQKTLQMQILKQQKENEIQVESKVLSLNISKLVIIICPL